MARRSAESILDGLDALEGVLRRAGFASTLHAVAAHTVFLDPATVRQAGAGAVFRIVRAKTNAERGSIVDQGGVPVLLDDNTGPTHAFLWAAGKVNGTDVQFNHVWSRSADHGCYTALWNLCATPAFLAKLTDTHAHSSAALKRRAFELYGVLPQGEAEPTRPPNFETLSWAPHPPAITDLDRVLRERLIACKRSRTAISARECGWVFSGFAPDLRIPAG